jgi:putative AdoMet-dependent methyltransferase
MGDEREGTDDRGALFDRWAAGYDRSVREIAGAERYPFAGYERVLDEVCREAGGGAGMRVLDLGTGTGNVARRLLDFGCRVWGTDFSEQMLERARVKLPGATLVGADLRKDWPGSIAGPFDRIVSAYVLHEFDLATKVSILIEARRRLVPGGRIVVGDVAFATRCELERSRAAWREEWDDSEHYWAADEALDAASRAGLRGRWTAISACAGVFVFDVDA